jgi:RNA polymerase sigma factor (sigma-70 family)
MCDKYMHAIATVRGEKFMQLYTLEETGHFVSPEERAQLVRLCAAVTREREAAEDLAQEALLEAWCHRYATPLQITAQRMPWLAGIARNMCLRWLRKRGSAASRFIQPLAVTPGAELADDLDLEVELERKELADLLDRALALLPEETRVILIQRYVEDSPPAEVAARLGINAHALTMRLQRGRLALRRVLTTTLGHELAPYAPSLTADLWEATPLWCYICGRQRLLGRRAAPGGELLLKCPTCSPGAEEAININLLPHLQGVKGYRPLLSRLRAWCDRYYRGGLEQGFNACPGCGRMAPVSIRRIEELPAWAYARKGPPRCMLPDDERVVSMLCPACEEASLTSLEGLVLCLPESRRFLQSNPRIRRLPRQQLEVDGRAALITRFECVTGSATLDVISAYDSYEVMHIEQKG